jgi:hypothetical protein
MTLQRPHGRQNGWQTTANRQPASGLRRKIEDGRMPAAAVLHTGWTAGP